MVRPCPLLSWPHLPGQPARPQRGVPSFSPCPPPAMYPPPSYQPMHTSSPQQGSTGLPLPLAGCVTWGQFPLLELRDMDEIPRSPHDSWLSQCMGGRSPLSWTAGWGHLAGGFEHQLLLTEPQPRLAAHTASPQHETAFLPRRLQTCTPDPQVRVKVSTQPREGGWKARPTLLFIPALHFLNLAPLF